MKTQSRQATTGYQHATAKQIVSNAAVQLAATPDSSTPRPQAEKTAANNSSGSRSTQPESGK